MTRTFDIEVLLSGVLTGSNATRQRHLRQAKVIQAAIEERWKLQTPWAWQRKHVVWFLENRLAKHSEATRYQYFLTVKLLTFRLNKCWTFDLRTIAPRSP